MGKKDLQCIHYDFAFSRCAEKSFQNDYFLSLGVSLLLPTRSNEYKIIATENTTKKVIAAIMHPPQFGVNVVTSLFVLTEYLEFFLLN